MEFAARKMEIKKLFELLKEGSTIVTLDKFEKNIFPQSLTYEDYMHHVNQGDLTYFVEIVENFNKVKRYLDKNNL
jgi:hypothetical protein